MIITRTSYRVSFAGGGTDLPSFSREEAGAVLSAAIDRSIYVTVHRRFGSSIRVSYSRMEEAATLDEVRHELVREAMLLTGVNGPLEVTTIGDVPAGTGMGSSSSLTVGLLAALYEYRGQAVTARRLAEEACRIEIDVLGKPIGRQDQYAAAFGGLNFIRFHPDDSVEVEPVACRGETLAELERWALLFFTGKTRDADAILGPQCRATASRRDTLRAMRDLAVAMRDELEGEGRLDRFAGLLHDGWELKRSVCCGITTTWWTLGMPPRDGPARPAASCWAPAGAGSCWCSPRPTATRRSARRWAAPASCRSGSRPTAPGSSTPSTTSPSQPPPTTPNCSRPPPAEVRRRQASTSTPGDQTS